jgi:deazaflavin-dependent oxidoreductase (nitroreductase family)
MTDFPDVRWGSESSWLRRPAIKFASTRAGSWLLRTATPLDRRLLLRTDGRFTLLGPVGAPTVLLETTGAKTGLPRVTPLIYVRDGDRLIVVGSNFGQAHHPAWSGNLIKCPDAVVIMGGRRIPVRAELLTGRQAEDGYRLMSELADTYTVYRGRTDRQIRVFALTRRPLTAEAA